MDTIDSLRQYRIVGFAIFDFAVSFLAMFILSPLLSWLFKKIGIYVPKKNWVLLTIPLSVVAHVLVGKITPFTQYFLDLHGHYLIKLIVIGFVILGLKDIKRISRV